ncbi:unnamed protein product [marine sediment metagenome]|uniref:Uncharacterized protein n=1 Tax=marine sediment metagenome TaxID=412755 RepID=X1TZY8_9ZZZZ
MLSRNGKNNSNGSFDWKDAVMDAGISAGLTFFTTLGALGAMHMLSSAEGYVAAGIAAGGQFFAILCMKRGLIKKSEKL